MKVTVCFGSTRVVVPCGEGDFKVKDLITKAISRYKKASDKPSDCWVTVHNLHQLDGGILDPDDRLHDVADDREQLIAIYEETEKLQQGDGTSESEGSETDSPNILKCMEQKFEPFSRIGIEITGEELNAAPPPLHVRRGSEPALNRLSPIPPYTSIVLDPNKRWSAAPVIDDQAPQSSTPLKNKGSSSLPYEEVMFEEYPGERGEGSGEEKNPSSSSVSSSASSHHSSTSNFKRFSRDSNRCSTQIPSENCNLIWWTHATNKAIGVNESFSGNKEMLKESRKEPLGGTSTPKHSRDHSFEDIPNPSELVCLKNDGTPLGIHVIPSVNDSGKEHGLLVEGIEPDGRVARDGRIKLHDIITEINGKSLKSVNFQQAQEVFKAAMMDNELRLYLLRNNSKNSALRMIHVQERLYGNLKRANVTQTKKTPSLSLSSRTQAVMLHSNTRKIGKRLAVKLLKGPYGLGFSITTRDNPAGGEAPIYIKNILPKGAAIEEGTLKIGDRLLEVNGVEVTGLCQPEVANLLRQISVGNVASLIISRHENVISGHDIEEIVNNTQSPSPKLPRQLVSERISEDSFMFPWKQREILTFEIPVHDSERAGLGVSVKGKTSSGPNGSVDLGIFVKNVIHGGAASRDGRLHQNDQLVNINGLSLLGKSNSEAMKTLRTAMHQEVPTPGKITLLVARRIEASQKDLKYFNSSTTHNCLNFSEISDHNGSLNSRKNLEGTRNIEKYFDYENSDTSQINNPFIYRLKGSNCLTLRNESYYKATHETWNSTFLHQINPLEERQPLSQEAVSAEKFSSPTIIPPSRDSVLIHDEYGANFSERTPLDESGVGFSRDQFGRQSISEKRHAALDARNTDTYQRNKKAREDREKSEKLETQTDPLGCGMSLKQSKSKDVGPGLGMRKSSSLESLQTLMQEMLLEDDIQRMGSSRAPRGRGCNESFRAAVDRSYDAPPTCTTGSQMETLTEEESESSGSGFGRGNSCQSSVNSSAENKLRKKNKKREKIFKGLGSMFRFGKTRKSIETEVSNLMEEKCLETQNQNFSIVKENFACNQQDILTSSVEMDNELHTLSGVTISDDEGLTHSERMHQLRAEHRLKHMKRNGAYPTDDLEDHYRISVQQRMETMPVEPKAEIQHVRSLSYDFYGDSKEKNLQAKFSDRNKFSHYVNYEQIQIHLRKNMEQERLAKLASQQYQDFREKQTSREHRGYQSQRCPRENPYQQRPVSNYFEYESVQAVMNRSHGKNPSFSSMSSRPMQPLPQYQMRDRHQFKQVARTQPRPPPINHKTSFSPETDKCDNNTDRLRSQFLS